MPKGLQGFQKGDYSRSGEKHLPFIWLILIVVMGLLLMLSLLISINFNLRELMNKKIEPAIITNTVHYYNGKRLKHCPLTQEIPCADLRGNIIFNKY